GGGGLLVGRAPDEPLDDVEPLIDEALRAAHAEGISGPAVTPYVLAHLHRESAGRTLHANRALVAENARLAGEIAVAAAAVR
ncbi:MAG TPA: pseudouridine-5'-phosphate glycosidase, partial [Gaiellaceae bacterium]|nr:pseudouridine-5'-phosphate glycosidase [Gaiellaceae bacterium]